MFPLRGPSIIDFGMRETVEEGNVKRPISTLSSISTNLNKAAELMGFKKWSDPRLMRNVTR